jgi:hypothetical protein
MVATGAQRLGASDSVDVPPVAPGLQSATVTVVAGEATVTTDDGAVQVPAGVSLTWSVAKDSDATLTLSTLQVEAAPPSDALVTWTRLS